MTDLLKLLKLNRELELQIAQRQGVEASLRQSEEKSRSLIENALDILTILDVNGIIQYKSASIQGVLGYRPEDLLGTYLVNLVHPQDAPDVLGTMQHIIQKPGASQSVQFRCRHKDGSWRVLEAIGKIFTSDNSQNPLNGTVILNARDVTERQRLQTLVARAGNYYLTLLEEFPALIWRSDVDGACNYFNKTWLTFTGRTMRQEVGVGWLEGIQADDRAACLATCEAAFAARQPFEREYRLRRADGEYRWIVDYGRPFHDLEGDFGGYIGACYDVTERRQTLLALQESELRFRTIVTATGEGIWLLNEQAHTVYANERLTQMLGYSLGELQGHQACEFMDEAERAEAKRHFERCAQGLIERHDFHFRHKDGSGIWTLLSTTPIFDHDQQFMGALVMLSDITERKHIERQLEHSALYDALTGLPNRALFQDRLERAFTSAKRHPDYLFAVLFLDFDGFKIINDSLGHAVGDQLLIAIAQRLQECVRSADTVGRMGGDEFTILLDGIADLGEATQVAERILSAVKLPFELDGQPVFAPVSIGIALNTPDYERPDDLLRDADTAMYRAKALGRARYEIFNVAMRTQALQRLQLETELHQAVEQEEFTLYYQPIVELPSGRLTGFEALVRWQHPQRGLLGPGDFIPIAEATGRVIAIDRWVLLTACRQMRAWQERAANGAAPLTISVNLSSKHFSTPALAEQVEGILNESGLAGSALKLEITESAIMDNTESAVTTLRQLSALGIQLSMDDFGTGYSSLGYLHRFNFDVLKVDRSFINQMVERNENLEIIQAIVSIAASLHIQVVAEGVETAQQLTQLRTLDCQYGQGYYFSKPLEPAAAEALMSRSPRW